ncbi:MAG: iron ABC transporter [marine bacterium B5-7]|nr:MAG: iron ABC transporter [marine bacterium B5-7]
MQPHQLLHQVVFHLRLPRAGNAFITGGCLALSGCLLQSVLRNPLADPTILGVAGGASVFALIALIAMLSWPLVMMMSGIGALLTLLLLIVIVQRSGHFNPTRVLLCGLILCTGFGAIISFLLITQQQSTLTGMLFWLMGGLHNQAFFMPGFCLLSLCFLFSLFRAKSLDILLHGETHAKSLGIHTNRLQWQLLCISAILTATAVTLAGPIGFIGLLVPHTLRLLGLRTHRVLLPAAVLAGGSLLTLADTIARTAWQPLSLPVGIIMAVLGVPLLLCLLLRMQRGVSC